MRTAIETSRDGWENLYAQAAGPENLLIVGIRKDEHSRYRGMTLRALVSGPGSDLICVHHLSRSPPRREPRSLRPST